MRRPRTMDFEGHSVTAVWFRDRWVWRAAQIGVAIGYKEGRVLVDKIRGSWSKELIEGKDYEFLKGADLKEFLDASGDSPEASESGESDSSDSMESPRKGGGIRQMLVLTECGIDTATMLSRTEKGRRLRRVLADYVIPQLRETGTVSLPGAAPALTPAQVEALATVPALAQSVATLAADVSGLTQSVTLIGQALTANIRETKDLSNVLRGLTCALVVMDDDIKTLKGGGTKGAPCYPPGQNPLLPPTRDNEWNPRLLEYVRRPEVIHVLDFRDGYGRKRRVVFLPQLITDALGIMETTMRFDRDVHSTIDRCMHRIGWKRVEEYVPGIQPYAEGRRDPTVFYVAPLYWPHARAA